MVEKQKEETIKYYMRRSGIIVRVRDEVALEYLSKEFNWIPNQEWYVSMFVDGTDDYIDISEKEVEEFLEEKLNSKKMTR